MNPENFILKYFILDHLLRKNHFYGFIPSQVTNMSVLISKIVLILVSVYIVQKI